MVSLKPDQGRLNFKSSFTVRGCELDQFNRAGNSVYLNYFEQARWDLLRRSGTFEYFSDNEILPAIIEIGIRYESEAQIFDVLEVETTVRLEAPYFVFDQVMHNVSTGRRCCTAAVKQLLVDTREQVAFEVPGDILEKWGL